MAEGEKAPLAKWNVDVGSDIHTITLSLDCTRVVCGSQDGFVHVLGLQKNAEVLSLIKGHTDQVLSVAISPDNVRVVSSSKDCTIYIWDVRAKTPSSKPLQGHTGTVFSLAFSFNSTRIVSGSQDHTVRIWKARTGTPVGEPLRGHSSAVLSVAFSPDDTRIVSGSSGRTVHVWDASSGTLIHKLLKGHALSVRSVAFSPNGANIISGSDDHTICIWDAHTGTAVGKQRRRSIATVWSVGFSPDNTLFVSGSSDHTIRIWDAITKNPIVQLSQEHKHPVQSVVFSPDGARIVSASTDGRICAWEAPNKVPSSNVLSSKTSPQEMFNRLIKHGCTDLTAVMATNRHSSSPIASGGFGDVRRSKMVNGTYVAVKTLRLHTLLQGKEKGTKRAIREVYMWSKLRHPNVQELLGIIMVEGELGMISPWMEQGNLQQYIAAHPEVRRYPLCVQVATGVEYLHGIKMVHGDLKANNVLVSRDGILKINDFDHAIMSENTLRFSTTTRPGGGTLRWMAPELFQAEDEEANEGPQMKRNMESDVYALGMTMLEIITGSVPYAEYRTDAGVYGAIFRKEYPKRPKELLESDDQTTRMWALLTKCWDYNPVNRPSASSVLRSLTPGRRRKNQTG